LQMVHASADHLLNTINEILDFSKIEAGKLEMDHNQFNLQAVVKSVLATAAARAQGKGLQFITHLSPHLPAELIGDPVRLRQVVINLLDNALKFTHDGHIEFTLDLEETSANSVLLHFSIADTGIGIPRDMLETVFESFTQVDSSITRRFGGTGLGLSIVRSLAMKMVPTAEITVESTKPHR